MGCGIWFLRLFILPHMLAGVFLISQFLLTLLTAAFGRDTLATVTKARTEQRGKEERSTTLTISISLASACTRIQPA
jgi:hypothetical protein